MVYKKGALSRYARGPSFLPFRSTAGVASKALHLASKVARALNVEKKAYTISSNGDFSGGNLIGLINAVAQGDGGNQRDGDQIKCMGIGLKVAFYNALPDTCVCRAMIVHDKQSDGTAPTVGEILDITTSPPYLAMNNLNNKYRFKILADKKVTLQGKHSTDPGGETDLKTIELWRKLNPKRGSKSMYDGIRTRYSGTSGAVSDVASNGIYLVLISSNLNAGVAHDYNVRLRYVDN